MTSPSETSSSGDDRSEPEVEADRQADAMKDQLRKDVASWAAARSNETPEPIARPVKAAASPATPRAPRKAKAAEPAAPVATEKKPFRMSYDGTTDKDYIAQRIKLGAR